jgi:hypothetical protein
MSSRQRKRRTFLAEVRRRKVVRTAVVYGAGAFATTFHSHLSATSRPQR